jgi:Fe-S-cluster containining protein
VTREALTREALIKDPGALDAAGLRTAFEAELEAVGENLGVPDPHEFRESVLAFPDVREIFEVWERVRPEWRSLLAAELKGAARDIANAYKTECRRCGRCCHCQIYIEAADCERGAIRPEHVEVLLDGRFVGGETIDDWRSLWDSGAVVRLKHQGSGSCVFHDEATHLCTIYEGRAAHCRNFFCYEDLKRRESFSFPDLVQHLGGQGFEPFAITVVFINLYLWRKADELRRLESERRREFAEMMGIGREFVDQFLGPGCEERLRSAAEGPQAGPALKEYAARLGAETQT